MSGSEKSCGDCTLCCKLMAVGELNKPQNVWCQHLVRGKGCGIYETRPKACGTFYCRWMKDPDLGPEWKPNKSKMVMAHTAIDRLAIYVDAGATGVWRKEPFLSKLVAMARKGIVNDVIVKIIENGRTQVILPNRVVDLGVVNPDDRIVLAKIPTASGITYDVSVSRAG